MNFKIPKEFEDFVSNAQDLLSQFGTAQQLDHVTFRIFPGFEFATDISKFLDLHLLISNIFESLSYNYIWNGGPLALQAKIPNSTESNLYFEGKLQVGDNIEDEWFIVYALLKLSEALPELSIRVFDVDGEFLLIESADHLPDWLGPENSENRVWIKNGRILIVDVEEGGKLRNGGIKLSHALSVLNAIGVGAVADMSHPYIQESIARRSLYAYPFKAQAMEHNTVCIIPRLLAILLAYNPHVITSAINGFCSTEKISKRDIASMSKFLPFASDMVTATVRMTRCLYAKMMFKPFNAPKRLHSMKKSSLGERPSVDLTHAFDIGCRILCGAEVAYQTSRRIVSGEYREKMVADEAEKVKLIKLLEERKLVGFDSGSEELSRDALAAAQAGIADGRLRLADPSATSSSSDLRGVDEPESFLLLGVWGRLWEQTAFHEVVDRVAAQFSPQNTIKSKPVASVSESLSEVATDSAKGQSESDELITEAIGRVSTACLMEPKLVTGGDGEAWLYLSPEELELEMEARTRAYKLDAVSKPVSVSVPAVVAAGESSITAGESSVTQTALEPLAVGSECPKEKLQLDDKASKEGKHEALELQKIVDSMKGFITRMSDYEGIDGGPNAHQLSPIARPEDSQQQQQQQQQQQSRISKVQQMGLGNIRPRVAEECREEQEVEKGVWTGQETKEVNGNIEEESELHAGLKVAKPKSHWPESKQELSEEGNLGRPVQTLQVDMAALLSLVGDLSLSDPPSQYSSESKKAEASDSSRSIAECPWGESSTFAVPALGVSLSGTEADTTQAERFGRDNLESYFYPEDLPNCSEDEDSDDRDDDHGGDPAEADDGDTGNTGIDLDGLSTTQESIRQQGAADPPSALISPSLEGCGNFFVNFPSDGVCDMNFDESRPSSKVGLASKVSRPVLRAHQTALRVLEASSQGKATDTMRAIDSDDISTDDSDDEEDPTDFLGKFKGSAADSQSSRDYSHMQHVAASDSDDDSREQSDLSGDEDEADAFVAEYMATMDAELEGSTLVSSFERERIESTLQSSLEMNIGGRSRGGREETKSVGPVDVDHNLLKYLLESHAAQEGREGPAGLLLSQLGISLPRPLLSGNSSGRSGKN